MNVPGNIKNLESENRKLKQTIVELSKERDKYKKERDKYKKIFDVSADALSIIDLTSSKFIECNQSAIDMHGVKSNANFLNLSPSDLSPKYQPCGRLSKEMAKEYIENTVVYGSQIFQWTHLKNL